jgi:transcriptional regulator with XRE-family HTH domain
MKYNINRCKRQLAITGRSQADLARELNCSRSLVSKFFRKEGVRPSTAKIIIGALGLDLKDVLIGFGRRAA